MVNEIWWAISVDENIWNKDNSISMTPVSHLEQGAADP